MKVFLFASVGVASGILLSASFASRHSKATPSIRIPSSPQMPGKHQRLFDVQLTAPQGIPPSDQQDLVLLAKISLLMPYPGEVHYQWILPADAHLVEGEISDSVAELPEGVVLERHLTVQGVSLEDVNKLVILQVWMEVDGVKMGGSGIFAAKPELPSDQTEAQMKIQDPKQKTLPAFIHE